MTSAGDGCARVEGLGVLSGFREELYRCFTARAAALFELVDDLLCTDGPVKTLVDLALAPEHRRGHGAMYDGLNVGRLDIARLRHALAGLALPRATDGRMMLAVDASPWLRPDVATCPDRSFCHTYGRGRDEHRMIPDWPYSVIAALEPGRSSWTAPLDALRLEPGADVIAVTCAQVRGLVERLVSAGQWRTGDPAILRAQRGRGEPAALLADSCALRPPPRRGPRGNGRLPIGFRQRAAGVPLRRAAVRIRSISSGSTSVQSGITTTWET